MYISLLLYHFICIASILVLYLCISIHMYIFLLLLYHFICIYICIHSTHTYKLSIKIISFLGICSNYHCNLLNFIY